VNQLERHVERRDAFLVESAPGHRRTQIPALWSRFGCRECRGAALERLPIGEPRAFLFHVFGIPPFFDGQHAGLAEVLDTAGGHCFVQRILAGRRPDLHRHMQIAGLQACELRQVISRHVFDRLARLFQHRAHDPRADELPRPVVQRQLDRHLLGRLLGAAPQGNGEAEKRGRDGNSLQALDHCDTHPPILRCFVYAAGFHSPRTQQGLSTS
jgi:hypothetical protein